MSSLTDKIVQRQSGIRLYGLAPPKESTSGEQLANIVAQQVSRVESLGVDGLVVYDIQDESERIKDPRPFPFLPTLPADEYAHRHLAALKLPKIVYRSVTRDTATSFVSWITEPRGDPACTVLVGAPSRSAAVGLSLRAAYDLVREHAPQTLLGGIAIAERHSKNFDEHERMLAKQASGCRFFVTQAVYDVTSTLSVLSDYSIAAERANEPMVPIVLTFSPCGSEKTLAFMKWLGIAFPRWLENELRHAADPLHASIELCKRIFAEVWDYARRKKIPLGINVESVAIRKAEIEASLELSNALGDEMKA